MITATPEAIAAFGAKLDQAPAFNPRLQENHADCSATR